MFLYFFLIIRINTNYTNFDFVRAIYYLLINFILLKDKYLIIFIDIFHIIELSYLILFEIMTPKPPNGGCKDVESEICFNHRNFIVPLLSPHLGVWGSQVKIVHYILFFRYVSLLFS